MSERLHHKVSISLHLSYLQLSLALNCKVFLGRSVLHYTTLHILTSRSLLLIMTFGYNVTISFFIILQTFAMDFTSGEFPGHSRTGILLHSRNVLILLELWHGPRSYIKLYHICVNTTHSHESVFHSTNN